MKPKILKLGDDNFIGLYSDRDYYVMLILEKILDFHPDDYKKSLKELKKIHKWIGDFIVRVEKRGMKDEF